MGSVDPTKRRNRRVPKLSEMEWEILKPLWAKGPLAARDIYQAAPKEQDWAYKTVKTMLARLVRKRVLAYDQIGNSYLYRPLYSRAEVTQQAVGSFVRRVFDGALNPFIASFVSEVSEDELKVLQAELRRIKRERHGGDADVGSDD